MKARWPLASLLAALAGCSGPQIAAFNDQGGVISYHIVNSNLNDVLAVAERYCARDGRKAKLGTPSIGWDSMNVSFECVK
jgi:hypothetical protein